MIETELGEIVESILNTALKIKVIVQVIKESQDSEDIHEFKICK